MILAFFLQTIVNAMNSEFVNVAIWLNSNKLSVNINKTQYMITLPLMAQPTDFQVKMNNSVKKK